MHSAVFLDKDGTLVNDVPYNVDPARTTLTPDAGRGLRALQDAGYRLVVVSNQSGVARGLFSIEQVHAAARHLVTILASDGVDISAFYACPHHPDAAVEGFRMRCACRKPAPGMLHHAARDLGLDLGRSWMVGDILDDVEAGRRAGCRTVLIDAGNETEWETGPLRRPDVVAQDLAEAAEMILSFERTAVP